MRCFIHLSPIVPPFNRALRNLYHFFPKVGDGRILPRLRRLINEIHRYGRNIMIGRCWFHHIAVSFQGTTGGWSGGAKVLGKLSVPGRPTNLDNSRARAYCACSRCGWGLFGHFYSRLSFLFSFSLFGRRPDID